jgi:hypothetical protein
MTPTVKVKLPRLHSAFDRLPMDGPECFLLAKNFGVGGWAA